MRSDGSHHLLCHQHCLLWPRFREPLSGESASARGLVGTSSSAQASRWIVRLTEAAAGSITAVAPAEHLLDSLTSNFQVIRGLGLPGQVLVRAFSDAAAVRAALSANPAVASFEPEERFAAQQLPNDPDSPSMTSLHNVGQFGSTPDADINAPEAWDMDIGSTNVVVGVNDPRDSLGHGTHVAGTIGAIGNNGRGVTGINWRSSLMSLKFLDDSNQGLTSDAVLAVNYATMMRTRAEHPENVRVLNASWGQSGGAVRRCRRRSRQRAKRTSYSSPRQATATS